jgi:signal transduction histidine kinase/ligand-binding sensor domain-containing protein
MNRSLRNGAWCGLAHVILIAAIVCPRSAVADDADALRWTERTAPIFRLVASQSSDDAGVPYTGTPGTLAQDRTGFIWNGTDTGLERWDGYRIRTYLAHAGDPCALPANYVVTLYVDDGGRLWISTFGGGLAYYEPETDCIRTVGGAGDGLTHTPVVSLAGDPAGGLWLGTTAGLLHLSADLKDLSRLREDASAQGHLSHERIGWVLRDRHGVLWVGSARGLERRAPTQARFEPVALPAGAKVRVLLESSDGRIWAGTAADGAFVIDPSTASVQAIDDIRRRTPIPLIWRAAETSTGEIWFGTTGAGIIRVDPATLRARALRHQKGVATSLPEDAVVDLMRDRGGLLWVAGDSAFGFFNSRSDVATILTGDELNDVGEGLVKAMVPMGDGRMAITAGTEIALIGPRGTGAEHVALDPLPAPSSIATLATLDGHDLFAATQPHGLVWLDRAARRSSALTLPGPDGSPHVLALLPDAGRLWVGGTEGLWVVERRADGRSAPGPWLASRYFELRDVWEIALGRGDTRWVGTVEGLYRVNLSSAAPTHVQLVSLAGDPLADPHIKSLHTDREGRLWIGTNSEGLFVVDPATGPAESARVLQHLAAELPNGTVNKILEDGRGAVWVSTDRGIARIDGRSFAVSRLTRGDGIAISSYLSGACAEESCNELMFGGLNGITLIRPDRGVQKPEPPAVVITRISVGREEVPSSRFNVRPGDPVLKVPADAHSLAVEFAALDFSDPLHNLYEYRLEGYDRDWVSTGSDLRMAMYTNLGPGLYHLRVRGTDHTGSWSMREAQVTFRVAAAWYQSMWFHALEVLAVSLALLLTVKLSTVVLRARQRELESLVEERTQALVRATGERNSLIENLAHDLRTPLTSLRGYLDRLSLDDEALTEADRTRFIGIAVRQAERLISLVRELFELVRLDDPLAKLTLEPFSPAEIVQDVVQEFGSIAEGRSIDCKLEPGVESARIVGDISLFQRLIDNVVVNAVNHTPPGGKITVKLGTDDAGVVLVVSDTGRGIERNDLVRIFNRYERVDTTGRLFGAGLGLAIVKRILELHRGSIVVESEVGMGTRFTVRLPREGPAAANSLI